VEKISMIGKTLGHYRITEKLGEGGMGVVYKAQDLHLNRFVALKVLPPDKVADPDRRQRFTQEAKAASALNHPGIITIHDITSDGGVDFIAMEYVEGKTLDQLVSRKGMRLNEALKIGIEIADALAAAHAIGIIHRDIKPLNIMISDKGRAKVLDFGLAKLREAALPAALQTTESVAVHTDQGRIVGTVSYMSPEQAQGKSVDERSDIFSFGSLLYEMVSGSRPFQGNSSVATLAAIIEKDPPPLSGEIPAELQRVLARCLRKDPERRFQHIKDLKVELQVLKEDSESGKLPAAAASPARKRRLSWVAAAAALPLLAVAGWLFWHSLTPPLPPPRVVPLTAYPGVEYWPSFSPDGKEVALTWKGEKQDNRDIYVLEVGSSTPLRRTTDPAPDNYPAWSPDGRQIAFMRRSVVYLTSPHSGPERKLADVRPIDGRLSWSADGKWLAIAESQSDDATAISLIPVGPGEKRTLVSGPITAGRYGVPAFSPDGHYLAYSLNGASWYGDIYVVGLKPDFSPDGQPRRLTPVAGRFSRIAWTPDSQLIVYGADYHVDSGVYIYRISIAQAGKAERVELAGVGADNPAISLSGRRMAYSLSRIYSSFDIWKVEAGNPPKVLVESSVSELDPHYSPDGTRIAYATSKRGAGNGIWIANQDGSNPVQLVEPAGRGVGSPQWLPDGRWIAFDGASEDRHWDIFVVDAAGGQPRRLTPYPSDEHIPRWSRDGKSIYFSSGRTGRLEIWRMPVAGGEAVQMTDQGGGLSQSESWDGTMLFYIKPGQPGLFERPTAGGPERRVLESVGDFVAVAGGIYSLTNRELRFVDLATKKSLLVSQCEMGGIQALSVSPDGKSFIFSGNKPHSGGSTDLMLIENFR
jgi:eukaryotic-like serine/threonine-protein kinase